MATPSVGRGAGPPRSRLAVYDLTFLERDELSVGVMTLDRDANIRQYNRCEADHARRSQEGSVGRNFFDLAPCARSEDFQGRFERFAAHADDGFERFEFTYPFRWGAREVDIVFCRREGCETIDVITTSRGRPTLESTSRASDDAARIVRLNRERPTIVQPVTPDAVWREDLRTGELEWSREAYEICELPIDAGIPARGIVAFAHPDDAVEVTALVDAAIDARVPYAFEFRIVTARGNERFVTLRATVVRDGAGIVTALHGRASDVTSHRCEDDELWRLANVDRLTGIANRLRFETCLESTLDDTQNIGRKFAIVFIDLDRFKPINDTFGHLVGDAILRQVASRLQSCVRSNDLAARLGGDEFAILVSDYRDDAVVDALTRRVAAAFEAAFVVEDRTIVVTASVGVSSFPGDGTDAKTLLDAADTAMYDGKAAGDGAVVRYDDAIDRQHRERGSLESDLAYALERDQFEMYVQPFVDSRSFALVGAEALLRWNHPTRGVVSPNDFIPMSEANGSIIAIGMWILDRTCARIRETMDAGYPLSIAVNVSLVQFRSGSFVDSVRRALVASRIAPHLLVLELTETFASADFTETIAMLATLKALGVTLAIDDFGTGYSSLAHVKHFPVDEIKLDRAFVAEITTNARDRAIAETILGLAQKLGLDVVAEGIETNAQARAMRDLGCNRLQGYLFGRPTPACEFFLRFLGLAS